MESCNIIARFFVQFFVDLTVFKPKTCYWVFFFFFLKNPISYRDIFLLKYSYMVAVCSLSVWLRVEYNPAFQGSDQETGSWLRWSALKTKHHWWPFKKAPEALRCILRGVSSPSVFDMDFATKIPCHPRQDRESYTEHLVVSRFSDCTWLVTLVLNDPVTIFANQTW